MKSFPLTADFPGITVMAMVDEQGGKEMPSEMARDDSAICDPLQLDAWCRIRREEASRLLWSCRCSLSDPPTAQAFCEMQQAGCLTVFFPVEPGQGGHLRSAGLSVETASASQVLFEAHTAGLAIELEIRIPQESRSPDLFEPPLGFESLVGFETLIAFVSDHPEIQRVRRIVLEGGDDPAPPTGGESTSLLDPGEQLVSRLLALLMQLGIPAAEVAGLPFGEKRSKDLSIMTSRTREGRLRNQQVDGGHLWLFIDHLQREIAALGNERRLVDPPGIGVALGFPRGWVDARWGRWSTWSTGGNLQLECALPFEPVRLLCTITSNRPLGVRLRIDLVVERKTALQATRLLLPLSPLLKRWFAPSGSGSLDGSQKETERIAAGPCDTLTFSGSPGEPALMLRKIVPPADAVLVYDEEARHCLALERQQALKEAVEPGQYPLWELELDGRDAFSREELQGGAGPKQDDLALVICPPWETGTPPLWPSLLAPAVRSAGFRVTCFDVNNHIFRQIPESDKKLWEMVEIFKWRQRELFDAVCGLIGPPMDQAVEQVLARRPRVVGFTVTDASMRSSLWMARRIKEAEPSTKIIIGGPGIFWTDELPEGEAPNNAFDLWTRELLDPEGLVDVYLRGEAELSLPRLMHQLIEGREVLDVPGTLAFRGGRWLGSLPPVPLKDLDALPISDYSDFDMGSYPLPAVPLMTSRGCFRRCAFCNDVHIQGAYRHRSAEHIFKEVLMVHRRYGVVLYLMVDLMINGNLKELERFCELVIKSGIPIQWTGQAMVNPGMDRALLQKMARAGCLEMTFGVESLCQRVVNLMRKGYKVTDALRVMREARREGITTAINLIAGFPGETEEMFQETLEVMQRDRDAISRIQAINVCCISASSDLWRSPEQFNMYVGMPEAWYRWSGPSGNTHLERKRRMAVLKAAADRLGLTVGEENLYDEQLMRIDAVDLLDAVGQRRPSFHPHEPLDIIIQYEVLNPVSNPLFRVQIIREEDQLLAFGTNTERVNLQTGILDQGSGEVTVKLDRLNLAPGKYRLTVGIWPHERSQYAFDVRHGLDILSIAGETDGKGGLAALVAHWQDDPSGEEHGMQPPDGAGLQLVLPEGMTDPVPAGAPLQVRCLLFSSDTRHVALKAAIMYGDVLVHSLEEQRELRAGQNVMELCYERVTLIGNTYDLVLSLGDPGGGDPWLQHRRTFSVAGQQGQGAGIALHQASWSFEHRAHVTSLSG